MPNGTYERIKKFSDTLPLKIIMYKHYYAQGPPAYPDIHILMPDMVCYRPMVDNIDPLASLAMESIRSMKV